LRFLIDNALSPLFATGLQSAGHDAAHIRDYHMQTATDSEVFAKAAEEDRILVSTDTDFATILARWEKNKPSVILLRRCSKRPRTQLALLLANLERVADTLEEGSLIVVEPSRIRVRRLPVGGPEPVL